MSIPSIAPYSTGVQSAANRTQWPLHAERSALLVHDMQNHFVGAFEREPEAQIERAVVRSARVVEAARAAGVPVIYTAQPPQQDGRDRQLLTDFWGPGLASDEAAHIIEELAPSEQDVVLTKWRYSAFFRTDLLDRLRNQDRDELIIVGVYSHIGCLTTALEAFMHGIKPFFVADAQADFSAADHDMAQRYVATRCGQVVSSDDVVEALAANRVLSR